MPQQIAVTRYHSLAGTHETLPDCLEVSARTESGIIMGVRHKEYTVEGVQFHPESILTEEGHLMISNFLNMEGGYWDKSKIEQTSSIGPANGDSKKESILDKIYAQRRLDVEAQKKIPGNSMADFEQIYELGLSPPLIDFPSRLCHSDVALLSEIKRASPSKGNIDLNANAPSQARLYALSGASAISVLTEPHWFKGSIEDMRLARAAIDGLSDRPAVLRKEFVFDEYQILEARINGADTVLLIVKMLDDSLLKRLYAYSKSLGMEPLVEVNSAAEMVRALELGAKVIGVNNRDLHSFAVDLGTTSSLVSMVPQETILCALSGITSRLDIDKYLYEGVHAFLIGEALMRAKDTKAFIHELVGLKPTAERKGPLVKICGVQSAEVAKKAVELGADLIGMILVPNLKRTVSIEKAREISSTVKSFQKRRISSEIIKDVDWFNSEIEQIRRRSPLVVGVFRNQPLSEVLALQAELDLDLVQFHGNEPLEWARLMPVPVIKKFDIGHPAIKTMGYHSVALIDGGVGGEGTKVQWSDIPSRGSFMLAGGLNPENVAEAAQLPGIIAVDVSSGVETDGKKDLVKIEAFIKNAKL